MRKFKLKKVNIKKGDGVVVLTGKDKGKQGKVLNIDYKTGRVLVEGVNVAKKAVRRSEQYPQGGIIDMELTIDISNIKLVCPKCNKPTKVTWKKLENGNRVRICKECNEIIDKI